MSEIQACFADAVTDLDILPDCLADYGVSLDLERIPYTACVSLYENDSNGSG